MMRFVRGGLIVVAGAALAAAVAVALRPRATRRENLVPRTGSLNDYVGAAKCADCHREIYERQAKSRMARALATGEMYYQQHELPVPAEVADSANGLLYRVDSRQGRLYLEVSRGRETAGAVMAYALGSGQRGLSFVRERDADNYEELRVSFYADTGSWDLTPGQEHESPASLEEALGRRVSKRGHMACLNCHASRLVQTDGRVDASCSLFGVDCERCHGPGREHIEAAHERTPAKMRAPSLTSAVLLAAQLQKGQPPASPQDELLRRVALADDERLIRDLYVCGECHGRHQMSLDPADEQLARFQVPALVASRCYQRSGAKLRCTDCHDPHADAVHGDPRPYVTVCLRCHTSPQAAEPRAGAVDEPPPKICPENPRDGCVGCHMPVTTPMYRTRFTHHRIGLYTESGQALPGN